jgi:hypothetical protein
MLRLAALHHPSIQPQPERAMTRLPTSTVLCIAMLMSACTMFPRDLSSPPAPADGRAAAAPVQLDFATFKATEQSAQGGGISRVAYAERAGDAAVSALSVVDGDLVVKGQFLAAGRSAFAGVGVLTSSPSGSPLNTSSYRVLRIRLSAAAGVGALRVRLVGTDAAAQLSGCYPVVQQAVTPQAKIYEIALSRFASESYCGSRSVSAAQTLLQLDAIEVVDAASPVRPRAVQFSVGAISLAG